MNKAEQTLLTLYRSLSTERRQGLLDYAHYLEGCEPVKDRVRERVEIPRPEEESVVAAIRRLTASYPMLERTTLLDQTTGLMAQHLMHGRDAVEVIDQLEELFKERYGKFLDEQTPAQIKT